MNKLFDQEVGNNSTQTCLESLEEFPSKYDDHLCVAVKLSITHDFDNDSGDPEEYDATVYLPLGVEAEDLEAILVRQQNELLGTKLMAWGFKHIGELADQERPEAKTLQELFNSEEARDKFQAFLEIKGGTWNPEIDVEDIKEILLPFNEGE
jgi:hypothetical protein